MPKEESKTTREEIGWDIASKVNKFMDEQRLERLKQCRVIEQFLKHCQERRRKIISKEKNVENEWDIDQTVPGTRMMRYFGWHQEEEVERPTDSSVLSMLRNKAQSNDQVPTASIQPNPKTTTPVSTMPMSLSHSMPPSCAKESHALWGCRAVSLGCAGHLRHLRECFRETPNVLSNPNTAYEPSKHNKDDVPCRELQETLGKCVIQEAKALQQRLCPDANNE